MLQMSCWGLVFAMVLKPDQNQIFENQNRHPKVAQSAALTRERREAPPRPTVRKSLSAAGAIGELASRVLSTSQQKHGCSLHG